VLTTSGTATVAWNGTGTTTFAYVISHPASQHRRCPPGDTEATLRGSVVASRPGVSGTAGVKGAVHAKVCIDQRLDVSLAAGHAFGL